MCFGMLYSLRSFVLTRFVSVFLCCISVPLLIQVSQAELHLRDRKFSKEEDRGVPMWNQILVSRELVILRDTEGIKCS